MWSRLEGQAQDLRWCSLVLAADDTGWVRKEAYMHDKANDSYDCEGTETHLQSHLERKEPDQLRG